MDASEAEKENFSQEVQKLTKSIATLQMQNTGNCEPISFDRS